MILEQRNITPGHCSADVQTMNKLIELVKNTEYYFSRLFSVQVCAYTAVMYRYYIEIVGVEK